MVRAPFSRGVFMHGEYLPNRSVTPLVTSYGLRGTPDLLIVTYSAGVAKRFGGTEHDDVTRFADRTATKARQAPEAIDRRGRESRVW